MQAKELTTQQMCAAHSNESWLKINYKKNKIRNYKIIMRANPKTRKPGIDKDGIDKEIEVIERIETLERVERREEETGEAKDIVSE